MAFSAQGIAAREAARVAALKAAGTDAADTPAHAMAEGHQDEQIREHRRRGHHTDGVARMPLSTEDGGDQDDTPGEATKAYRAYLTGGHAADSPGNAPRAGTAARHPATGRYGSEIATGRATTPPGAGAGVGLVEQPGLSHSELLVTTYRQCGDTAPAGSHYRESARATATVRHLDARDASTPMVRDVSAARAPMAPGQVPADTVPAGQFGTAPAGVGLRPHISPVRPGGAPTKPIPGGTT